MTFFDGKTDAATKIGLLQNGATFAPAIKAQADSGLAKSSSAKVGKVTVSSADRAKVVYTVLLGGQPALKDQPGTAVREQGRWKVSAATFCALLTLEGQAPAACPHSSTSPTPG